MSRASLGEFHRLMGTAVDPGPLPQLSVAMPRELAERAVAQLEGLGVAGRNEGFIVQPSEDAKLPANMEDVHAGLRAYWVREQIQAPIEGAKLAVRSFERCFAVTVEIPGWGIPPGIGAVVDKYTGRWFSRRYIDVAPAIRDEDVR